MKKLPYLLVMLFCLATSSQALAAGLISTNNLQVVTGINRALTGPEQYNIRDINNHVVGSINDKPTDPETKYEFAVPPTDQLLSVSAPNVVDQGRANCPISSYPAGILILTTELDKNYDNVLVEVSTKKKGITSCGSFLIPRS